MKRFMLGVVAGAAMIFATTPAMANGPYRYGGPRVGFYAGYRPYYGAYRPYYGPAYYPPPGYYYPPPAYPAPVYPAPGIGVYTPGFSFSFR